MINAIVIILIAHLLGDMAFQGSFVSANKCIKPFIMMYHSLLVSLIVSYALYATLGISYWSLPILFLSHWYIDDMAKCKGKMNDWWDLCLHLIIIATLIII